MKRSSVALAAGMAALVFAFTFLYRFTLLGGQLSGFENDEYLVISRAMALLRGELPSRDFVDPGYPLAYVASALSIDAAGGVLLGHAVFTVSMLALGAALTFLIGRAASGSLVIGLLVVGIHVSLGPRLYNYPKIVLYAFAVLGWWAYVDRPRRSTLVALGVLTGAAFLFRHDHGAYIALGTAVMLAAMTRMSGFRRTLEAGGVYGVVALTCVAPYLVFLQRNGGVIEHVRVGLDFSRVDSGRTELRWPRFKIDRSAPWTAVAPPPAAPRPRVKVRWQSPAPSPAEASAVAKRYGLSLREQTPEGAEFEVIDESPDNLLRLVADPRVADTQNIDRRTGRVSERPSVGAWTRLLRDVPMLRTEIAPGIMARENAAPFVYYLFLALPVAAALVALNALRARRADAWRDLARMAPLIVLTVLLNQWFLRGTLPVRLADVSVLTAALGAWLLARAFWALPAGGGLGRALAGVMLLALAALTAAGAASIGAVALNLRTLSDGRGFSGVLPRARVVRAELSAPGPVVAARLAGGSASMRAAHYLHTCLKPSDRALVIGYRPEVFYFADRPFAGGQVDLRAGYLTSSDDQRLVIERMRRQSVPVVITEEKAVFEARYRSESPILLAYLDEAYADTGDRRFGPERLRVLIRRDRVPTGTYAALGTACFG